MSNNKQSSVELLRCKMIALTLLKLNQSDRDIMEHFFNQAKAMHKDEMRLTYNQGLMSNFQNFEDYYKKTFKGNDEQQ